jgi:cytochrome c oxidase subunit 1
VSSPPPIFNFDKVPTVVGGPYEYGVPGAIHGIFQTEETRAKAPAGATEATASGPDGTAAPSQDEH